MKSSEKTATRRKCLSLILGVRRQPGFTLIELVIVVAVMAVLLVSIFALNFRAGTTWASERERVERVQNFRAATERIALELRSASTDPLWPPDAHADLVVVPAPYQMSDRLRFRMYTEGTAHQYEYVLEGDLTSGYQVMRLDYSEPSYLGDTAPSILISKTAVTEKLATLASLYFAREGNRVVMILVAQYKYGGQLQMVSYTRQVSVRG